MVHFKYKNNSPLGDMIFPDGFWSEFYVETTVDRPEYPVIVESEEDQEGDMHELFQRWEKRYTVKFLAVESLCDTCSMLRLMDEVYINGHRVYDIIVESLWTEEHECLADVNITFLTRKVIKTL